MTDRAAWTRRLGAREPQETTARAGRSKYHAVQVNAYGRLWASKAELRRYEQLLLLGAAGEVRNLELQPRFDLVVQGERVGRYTPDFRFEERNRWLPSFVRDGWRDTVEEVKGYRVRDYRLRRQLFKALFPQIVFREVR